MQIGSFSLVCDKIRTLCKQCDISPLPHKFIQAQFNTELISSYLNGLDELRSKIFILRSQEEQYRKLQECLQKHQTQIRKHIGVEQQLKLYIDTLKVQYDESEAERLQLLQNSKKMIKQLKKDNQKLFQQVEDKKKQLQNDRSKVKLKKVQDQNDISVKNRIHTIGDIQHSHSVAKKKIAFNSNFKVQLSDRQNKKKKQEKLFELRKKQHQNFTMMNYISSNKKKVSKEREKTPARKRREIGGKINITSVFKTEQKSQKKANKSVFSLNSVDFAKEDPKPRHTKNVFSSLESGK